MDHYDNACPSLTMFNTIEEYDSANTGEIPAYQIFLSEEASKNGAVCLDGSVPDFYYRAGSGDGINKFILYFQGGGWCANLHQCAAKVGNILGSTKYDKNISNIATGTPYLSSNKTINPLTYNWNAVYFRYCDGSSYSSNNETILAYNSTINLYFRGFRILNGVVNVLKETYDFIQATDVILSGCSAGALGVFWHSDYVYDLISNIKSEGGIADTNFNYMAMPDAGYFMQVNLGYIDAMNFNWNYFNLSNSLNKNCVNNYTSSGSVYPCMYAFNVAPFIKNKVFSLQSQYDSDQIAGMGNKNKNLTYINEYGKNLTHYYITNYINTNQNHFGWLVSCYEHCIFSYADWNHITINGMTAAQAQINAWNSNDTNLRFLFQNYTYPCNNCCG